MGMVRPDARRAMTRREAPAPLFVSLPAFLLIAVIDGSKFLFLPFCPGEFRQFPDKLYAILPPSRKTKLLSALSEAGRSDAAGAKQEKPKNALKRTISIVRRSTCLSLFL
jgi:hypothetical protein